MENLVKAIIVGMWVAAGVGLFVRVPVVSGAAAARIVACRAADPVRDQFRQYILQLASGTDTVAVNRRAIWDIPAVSNAKNVAYVTKPQICDRAARVHAVKVGADTLMPPPVHVLQVGSTRYIVFNYTRVGSYFAYFVYDENFVLREEIMD